MPVFIISIYINGCILQWQEMQPLFLSVTQLCLCMILFAFFYVNGADRRAIEAFKAFYLFSISFIMKTYSRPNSKPKSHWRFPWIFSTKKLIITVNSRNHGDISSIISVVSRNHTDNWFLERHLKKNRKRRKPLSIKNMKIHPVHFICKTFVFIL